MNPASETPLDHDAWRAAVASGHALLARKARTFRLASAMLPGDLRDDIAILYAFCRIADDLADDDGDAAALDALDREIAGEAEPRPLVRALLQVARRHGVSLADARTLLDGVRSDLGAVRVADDAELLRYSFKVASTVGLMLSRILGARTTAAETHAADLGLAMQLTNIVRDVREDAAHGRVYLPRTRLAAHGATHDDVITGVARDAVYAVCLEVLELADRYYESGREGLRYLPGRHRFGVAVAHQVYGAIGWRIRRTGFHPLDGRMIVPRRERLAWLGRAFVISLTSASAPQPARAVAPLHHAHDVRAHGART